jgi:hypothetical protein
MLTAASSVPIFTSQTYVVQETPRKGKGGNSLITALIKVQKIQRGQEAPHNGSAILPKDVQMTPLRPKGLIDTILSTRLTVVKEGS